MLWGPHGQPVQPVGMHYTAPGFGVPAKGGDIYYGKKGNKGKGKGGGGGKKGEGKAHVGYGTLGGKGMYPMGDYWMLNQPQQLPAPQWQCLACGAENRLSRVECRRCWMPRPGKGARASTSSLGKGKGFGVVATSGASIGANGFGPLLGTRDADWNLRLGQRTQHKGQPKGGSKAGEVGGLQRPSGAKAATTTAKAGGGKAACAKGKNNAETDYTEVNYALGQRPKVEPAPETGAAETSRQRAKGHHYAATKFHLLADDDLDDDLDVDEQLLDDQGDGHGRDDVEPHHAGEEEDTEEQQEQQHHGGDGGYDDYDVQDPIQLAKDELQRRQAYHRRLRSAWGKADPATKMAAADVQWAAAKLREARGPKSWHVRARECERRAEAKERAAERKLAQKKQHEEWMAQVQQEFEEAQRQLDDAIQEDNESAREFRKQLEEIRHESDWDEGWAGSTRDDDTWGKLAELGQQLAVAQEKAAAQGCEELQQLLAAAASRMADLEATVDGGSGGGEGREWSRGTTRTWDEDHFGGTPPWRSPANDKDGNDETNTDVRRKPNSGAPAAARGSAGHAAKAGAAVAAAAAAAAAPAGGAMATDATEPSQQARDAQRAHELAMENARAAELESRRQKAMDKIRGQVQVEKNREAERRQKEAGINTLDQAAVSTPEQLQQNEAILEQLNKEFENAAEKRWAQLSEQEQQRLLEEASAYW